MVVVVVVTAVTMVMLVALKRMGLPGVDDCGI